MKLSGNTVLITGGSSGIGLELGRQLLKRKNDVIVCGRSPEKLAEAKKTDPGIHTFQCDLSDREGCARLADHIEEHHLNLNVLVNNAAIVHKAPFFGTLGITDMAEGEMAVNFLAPVRLMDRLHPILMANGNPTIINVTTGLIYAPRAVYPFYNATKAALHSLTQVLRKQMENTDLEIIEVMFPAVRTPWHKGDPPKIAISPVKAVEGMLRGLEKQKAEIRVAGAGLLYTLSRLAPNYAFEKVNSLVQEN